MNNELLLDFLKSNDLNSSDKNIYILISSKFKSEFFSYFTINDIMKNISISRSTIFRSLKSLLKNKYVNKIERGKYMIQIKEKYKKECHIESITNCNKEKPKNKCQNDSVFSTKTQEMQQNDTTKRIFDVYGRNRIIYNNILYIYYIYYINYIYNSYSARMRDNPVEQKCQEKILKNISDIHEIVKKYCDYVEPKTKNEKINAMYTKWIEQNITETKLISSLEDGNNIYEKNGYREKSGFDRPISPLWYNNFVEKTFKNTTANSGWQKENKIKTESLERTDAMINKKIDEDNVELSEQTKYLYCRFNRFYLSNFSNRYDNSFFQKRWDDVLRKISVDSVKTTVDNIVSGCTKYKIFPPDISDFKQLSKSISMKCEIENSKSCENCGCDGEKRLSFCNGAQKNIILCNDCNVQESKKSKIREIEFKLSIEKSSFNEKLQCFHLYNELFGMISNHSDSEIILNLKSISNKFSNKHLDVLITILTKHNMKRAV